jgi:hypothetical protein
VIAARLDEDPESGEGLFTTLIDDLTGLGYTAGDVIDGITTYAQPDGGGVLATIDAVGHQEARLSRRNDAGDPTWKVRLTADVPVTVQRIILYAMLHAGGGAPPALQRTFTDALDRLQDRKQASETRRVRGGMPRTTSFCWPANPSTQYTDCQWLIRQGERSAHPRTT